MLTVLDEYTRECRCIHVERQINADKVRQVMARLIDEHGVPECIRSDNGSEFIESNLREWLKNEGIKTLYIDPGSPWQNGFIESFHARLREECLNREQLWTLTEARVVIEDWRYKYNHIRPHRSLGYITPIQFAGLAIEACPLTLSASSVRRSLDFLYNLKETLTPPRLTHYTAQFG